LSPKDFLSKFGNNSKMIEYISIFLKHFFIIFLALLMLMSSPLNI
jgi:hypothetical protein